VAVRTSRPPRWSESSWIQPPKIFDRPLSSSASRRSCRRFVHWGEKPVASDGIPDRDEFARRVEALHADEEEQLRRQWPANQLRIAPGSDLLDAVLKDYGLRYDKSRDGLALARAISPPDELATVVESLVGAND
jgi:hypothetical protein